MKNVDAGLEYIRWIRGLGGEGLQVASDALPSNLKNKVLGTIVCDRELLSLFSTHRRSNGLYQTPRQRQPHITGQYVDTMALEWVEALNEHGPHSEFKTQLFVLAAEDSEPRRSELSISLSFSHAVVCLTPASGLSSDFCLPKVWDFALKSRAHSY